MCFFKYFCFLSLCCLQETTTARRPTIQTTVTASLTKYSRGACNQTSPVRFASKFCVPKGPKSFFPKPKKKNPKVPPEFLSRSDGALRQRPKSPICTKSVCRTFVARWRLRCRLRPLESVCKFAQTRLQKRETSPLWQNMQLSYFSRFMRSDHVKRSR